MFYATTCAWVHHGLTLLGFTAISNYVQCIFPVSGSSLLSPYIHVVNDMCLKFLFRQEFDKIDVAINRNIAANFCQDIRDIYKR